MKKKAVDETTAKVADYPFMLRVVLAAWDVIEHRQEDYLDNTQYPYAELKTALEVLANRGMEN
jgi:hypothetical protein